MARRRLPVPKHQLGLRVDGLERDELDGLALRQHLRHVLAPEGLPHRLARADDGRQPRLGPRVQHVLCARSGPAARRQQPARQPVQRLWPGEGRLLREPLGHLRLWFGPSGVRHGLPGADADDLQPQASGHRDGAAAGGHRGVHRRQQRPGGVHAQRLLPPQLDRPNRQLPVGLRRPERPVVGHQRGARLRDARRQRRARGHRRAHLRAPRRVHGDAAGHRSDRPDQAHDRQRAREPGGQRAARGGARWSLRHRGEPGAGPARQRDRQQHGLRRHADDHLGPEQQRAVHGRQRRDADAAVGRPAQRAAARAGEPHPHQGARRGGARGDRRDDADDLPARAGGRRAGEPEPGGVPAAGDLRRQRELPPEPEPDHRAIRLERGRRGGLRGQRRDLPVCVQPLRHLQRDAAGDRRSGSHGRGVVPGGGEPGQPAAGGAHRAGVLRGARG